MLDDDVALPTVAEGARDEIRCHWPYLLMTLLMMVAWWFCFWQLHTQIAINAEVVQFVQTQGEINQQLIEHVRKGN